MLTRTEILRWSAGGCVGGVFAAITMFGLYIIVGQVGLHRDIGRLQAIPEIVRQQELRFASDIEQHDLRIANNAENIRTILRMLNDVESR